MSYSALLHLLSNEPEDCFVSIFDSDSIYKKPDNWYMFESINEIELKQSVNELIPSIIVNFPFVNFNKLIDFSLSNGIIIIIENVFFQEGFKGNDPINKPNVIVAKLKDNITFNKDKPLASQISLIGNIKSIHIKLSAINKKDNFINITNIYSNDSDKDIFPDFVNVKHEKVNFDFINKL